MKRWKRWRQRLAFTGVMLALFLGVAYFFSSLFLPASSRSHVEQVEIPAHATASQIAALLAARGLIRNRYAFILVARVLGESKNLKPGDYAIDASDGLLEIIDQIARGRAIASWVTIPEGYTLAQIAGTLGQRRLTDPRIFEQECRAGTRRYLDFPVPRPSLEGYLLPDTYKFKSGLSDEEIIRAMTGNFKRRVERQYAGAIRASGRPLDQTIIVASLIEREARVPGDREKIAAVIYNRLRKKMPLQIDATVLYALGHHQARVSLRDTRVNSLYNTYRHHGLPPGPICNPGVDCIEAAIHPATAGYLYYVAQPDGSHYFSTTYAEHKQHGGT